jgi:hypothetical protein
MNDPLEAGHPSMPPLADGDRVPVRVPGGFTMVPNLLLDFILPSLSPTERAVLLYLWRHTAGFHRTARVVPLEQICSGLRSRERALDLGTRLSRSTTIRALRVLVARGYVTRVDRAGAAPSFSVHADRVLAGTEPECSAPRVLRELVEVRDFQAQVDGTAHAIPLTGIGAREPSAAIAQLVTEQSRPAPAAFGGPPLPDSRVALLRAPVSPGHPTPATLTCPPLSHPHGRDAMVAGAPMSTGHPTPVRV